MSLQQLKEQVDHLALSEQKELIAYMLATQLNKDSELAERITQKLDDKDPKRWITLEELQERFADDDKE
jgi:adenosyl cobinamide kinase/adenosyl cobinamide phosphate guanylyltransferase